MLEEKSTREFREYLEMVSEDFRASDNHATADDYDEMVRRLIAVEENEEAGHSH